MTRKEYIKYYQEMKDFRGKVILPGAIVALNSYCRATFNTGTVSHFTESGKVAIRYNWSTAVSYFAYRRPETIIVLKNGNKNKNKNRIKSKS